MGTTESASNKLADIPLLLSGVCHLQKPKRDFVKMEFEFSNVSFLGLKYICWFQMYECNQTTLASRHIYRSLNRWIP